MTRQSGEAANRAAVTRHSAELEGWSPTFVRVGARKTRFYEAGSGDPLVLVHGGPPSPTRSANVWTPNFSGLAASFRVLAPDSLGNGMTEPPERIDDYTTNEQVAHLWDFIGTVGAHEGLHLVGQSRGAYTAARLAMQHPDAVRTLTIIDSATLAPEIGDYRERRKSALGEAPRDPRLRFRQHHERLSSTIDHITDEYVEAGMLLERSEPGRRILADLAKGADRAFAASLRRQRPQTLSWLRNARIQCPTLVYWGAEDPTAILDQGIALFRLLSESNHRTRLVVVARAGHFHFRELPQEFSSNLTHFIRQWA